MVLGLRDVDAAVLLALARRIPENPEGGDADICHGVHERKGRPHALHPEVRRRVPELEHPLDGGELHRVEDGEEQHLPRRKRDDLPRAARELIAPPQGGDLPRACGTRGPGLRRQGGDLLAVDAHLFRGAAPLW